jgi:hypothetical protein
VHDELHVEVTGGHSQRAGDGVHVQRGQLGVDLQVVDAGFFGCFAQRGGDNAGVGLLTVPAQL